MLCCSKQKCQSQKLLWNFQIEFWMKTILLGGRSHFHITENSQCDWQADQWVQRVKARISPAQEKKIDLLHKTHNVVPFLLFCFFVYALRFKKTNVTFYWSLSSCFASSTFFEFVLSTLAIWFEFCIANSPVKVRKTLWLWLIFKKSLSWHLQYIKSTFSKFRDSLLTNYMHL